ncbi:MAG: right-handed parallel beta-helix repeat-containing protein [Candidatus Glassbacteria bacterium]
MIDRRCPDFSTAVLLFFLLSLADVSPAPGRTLYLAPDGDDSAKPEHGAVFRTLEAVISVLWGGDTLFIRNGIYRGGVTVRRGCSPEAPLVIRGESKYAIIRGSGEQRDGVSLNDCLNVVLDGINVTMATRGGILIGHSKFITVRNCRSFNNGKWGIFTDHSSDFRLEGNECFGSQLEHGIYHSNSGDNFTVRGNYLHDNSGCGLHVNGDPEYGGDGVIQYGLIEKNLIVRNGACLGGAGINMTHVQDVIVRNNLLYHNLAGGITYYQDSGTFVQGSKRALIYGNTVVYRPGEGRSGVNIMTTSEKAVICGNIFVSGGSRGCLEVNSEHLGSIVSDGNLLWGTGEAEIVERSGERRISLAAWRETSGNDRHSLVADPLFREPEFGDFRLQKGSPAVGATPSLAEIKALLVKLGGFDWHLKKLDELPDDDFAGRPRGGGKGRTAGAYTLEE